MVVRHLRNGELTIGHQDDNLKDERGRAKKPENGYRTKRMLEYQGVEYNLKRLCEALRVNYSTANAKMRKGTPIERLFAELGFPGVILKPNIIQ